MSYKNSLGYEKVSNFYGINTASRSKLPLMNHVNEGCILLESLGASQFVLEAFCLHPILQATEDFLNAIEDDFYESVSSKSLMLAVEYRHVANSFLSNNVKENVLPLINEDMRLLLIADKVQNYKDFLRFHKDTHTNSKRLDEYFNDWFKILNINYQSIVKPIELLG